MPTLPNGFDIPIPFLNQSFHIYYYGILITLGVIAAAFLGQAEAKRRGMNPEFIWDALFWVVLAGIIGARIWHILTPPPSMVAQGITTKWYLMHPLDMLNIRNGGLGIPGAVIGGALALWIYCRRKGISFLTWADVAVPGVALAQAIGRWGNFFNQEVYGLPTNLPWKIYIDPLHRVEGYQTYEYFHPLFFYESLWNVVNMAVLLREMAETRRHLPYLLDYVFHWTLQPRFPALGCCASRRYKLQPNVCCRRGTGCGCYHLHQPPSSTSLDYNDPDRRLE
jgi:prolipoprotein diacylglyceryl transferase